MSMSAREAALRTLAAYRRENAWSGAALGALIDREGLERREAALASRIVNGVLQNMALCDYYISRLSAITLRKIEPQVLDILRISIYQIVFMTKIPNSAAVNEGVKLTKKHASQRAAGFVNAVLRKAATGGLPDIWADTPQKMLAVKYSHPEWLVREFSEKLGMEGCEALLKANNCTDTPVTAQVNTLISRVETVLAMLEEDGVHALRHEWLEGAVNLYGAGNIERLRAFAEGHIYIQDAAARLAVTAAGLEPGNFVIDACSAPGGKSFAAAIDMENTGGILSCDIHDKKLRHITNGAKRLGIEIITAVTLDASRCSREYMGSADVVIADVPCSGLGVIRKKPEMRYKNERDIGALPDVQLRILKNLADYVKPDGVLLYATCTVLRSENEGVIETFLSENNMFRPDSFSLPGSAGHVPGGMVQLWPHIHGTDGFFICKLRKL